jgi:DNA polymerase V|tara:strand:+ start:588 stop:1871 length:1284 start_codon:yes stop_codon:yes gene_type:complete
MSSIKYTTKKNKIALVDCNSFYVSCERLFNPKIQKKAVVVLSNNDGCVISRSREAKDLGIKMGEPYFKVKELVKKNKVEVYSSNYALYGDISRRVMKVLKTFSPKVEIYSIDEAFIDLSFIDEKGVEDYGREIRSRVLKWTGIPTSVGIASTKTLSKVANHIAKKEKAGVIYLNTNIDEKLKKFPIEDVWGVGKQLSKFYHKNNISNAYDLKNVSNTWVKKGTNVLGAKTAMELRGIPCIDLQIDQEKRKNCCVSRSFGRKVKDLNELEESVITHCLNAAEKIRADDQIAKTITVFIRTSPFDKNRRYYSNSKTIDLAIPTSNSIELIKNAVKALTDIYKYGYAYQKAGIILSGLKDANQNDQNLLTPLLENKSKKLMKAIDYTNTKYGRYAISIAQAGLSKGWKMRREHSSKIDTASFDSLPKIVV